MRSYTGKATSRIGTLDNEVISFTFNGGFRQGTTALLISQWTKTWEGNPKVNYIHQGTITKLENGNIEIFKGEDSYYW
jgi:hypothetical protein